MIKIVIFLGYAFMQPLTPVDSIGTETINGKVFVIHRVTQGETLYAISRHYGTPIPEILEYNSTADAGLEIGQILKVPYTRRTQTVPSSGRKHTVQQGETLFSISRTYEVTVDELRKWNNLPDNSISVGQELTIGMSTPNTTPVASLTDGVHVVAQGETLYSISRQFGVEVRQLMTWNNLPTIDISIGQTLFVRQPMHGMTTIDTAKVMAASGPDTATFLPKVQRVVISEAVKGSDEVRESGLAELIDGTEGNRKYLALHRTAAVGTILKVMNEMNNREVFVRVVGKLPDTAQNKGLLIKVSRSAYDRLSAIDPRFRVEVTYYK